MARRIRKLKLYHGGRIEGPVEVRPQRAKDMQHGPGFYLTDTLSRAASYAKGGKRTYVVTLRAPRLLNRARLPRTTMENWIKTTPKLRNRAKLLADFRERTARYEDESVPANVLVNLGLYHGSLGAATGPALAKFYVDHGIQAERTRVSGETWWTVFDPSIIEKVEVARPGVRPVAGARIRRKRL